MASLLLVDDDPDVLAALATALRSGGHDVDVASGGLAALGIVERSRIDLLLTDVVMRGMNGFKLARQAVQIRPTMKVLYYTGFTEFLVERDDNPMFGKLLSKPLRVDALLDEVDAALTPRADA
jgi:DNA-binding NtrC family response regulator